MNLIELSNALLAECEGSTHIAAITTIPLASNAPRAQARAVSWIQTAYRRVQLRKRDWKFHWKSGTLLTTVPDRYDYTLKGVREIVTDGVLCRRQGETAVWPLAVLPYQTWMSLFRVVWPTLTAGTPQWLCQLPNGKWRVTPKPLDDTVFEVLADWYEHPSVMEVGGDEPIWDEEWHELLVWEAAKHYLEEYDKPSLAGRIQENLGPLERSFYNRYSPDWGM